MAVGEKFRRSKLPPVKNAVGPNFRRSKLLSVKIAVGQNGRRSKLRRSKDLEPTKYISYNVIHTLGHNALNGKKSLHPSDLTVFLNIA
jgi:hypothetical protein